MQESTFNNDNVAPKDTRKESILSLGSSDTSDTSDASDGGHTQENERIILPPFPLKYFPREIREAMKEVAAAINISEAIPATALICCVGALIGRKRGIQAKPGWVEFPNLYIVLAGSSGSGKTPGIREVNKHIDKLEGDNGFQLIVNDATLESLPKVFEENPNGLLWYRDEGFFTDLNKYTGVEGSTQQRLNSAYSSEPWRVNRADKDKNTYIPRATLSIHASIQPGLLEGAFKRNDIENGFLPRFLFAVAQKEGPRLWTDISITSKTNKTIEDLLTRLHAYDYDKGESVIIPLSHDALEIYKKWYDKEAYNGYYAEGLEDALAQKRQAQCLRLALITHCIGAIIQGKSELEPVSPQSMERAITLAGFFSEHQKYVLNILISSEKMGWNPIQTKTAMAVIQLELEIDGGYLSTARVTEAVNQSIGGGCELKPQQVGKALGAIGLSKKKDPSGDARGWIVLPEDIKRLKRALNLLSDKSESSEN